MTLVYHHVLVWKWQQSPIEERRRGSFYGKEALLSDKNSIVVATEGDLKREVMFRSLRQGQRDFHASMLSQIEDIPDLVLICHSPGISSACKAFDSLSHIA
jgi:hypothetical protein